MATLGELVVTMSANTAQFTGAMDKAAYQSQKRMGEMLKSAHAVGVAIGGALVSGATAFSLAMKGVIDQVDALGESAQKLGLTTEALSGLEYVAALSGVTVETLHGAVNKLNRSIADGNPAFDAMGISLKSANGELKAADQVLREVAEKFSTYKDGAEKSALAMEFLGKSGADMVPMLNQGEKGFKALTEEAQRMGLIIGTDVTEGAGRLNDVLDRVVKTQQGMLTQLLAGMLPTLERASAEFELLAKNTDLVSGPAKAATILFQTLAVVGSDVAFVFKMTGQEIGGIAAQLASFARLDFKGAFAIGDAMKEDAAKARAELDAFQARIMNIGTAAAAEGKKAESTGGIAAPIVAAAARAKSASAEIDKAAREALRAQQALIKEGQGVFEQTRTPLEQLNLEYTRLNKLLDAGVISWDTYSRAVFDAQDRLQPMADAAENATVEIKKIAETTSTIDTVITNAFGNMGDAVADFAMGGKVSFAGMVNAMIRDLIRLEAQTQMTAIWKQVGGFSGVLSSIGGLFGGSSSGIDAVNSFDDGSMFNALAGTRATGGPVNAGQYYLVGENGPEILLPSSSGTVLPNKALAGGGSVVNNVSVVVNADGSKSQGNTSDAAEIGRRIEGVVRGVLMTERRPGGLLAA